VPLGRDHVVEATIVGTAITQFASFAPPPIYGIRKLDIRRPAPPPQVSVNLGAEDQDDAAGSPDADPDVPGS
jgi:hypothetical protein